MKLYLLLACLLELTGVRGAAVTTSPQSIVRPGVCPEPEELILEICFRKCNVDSDCTGIRKCCGTSCGGYYCQIPNDKPGSCPPLENNNVTTCAPSIACTLDTKCEGEQKCCPNPCNNLSCQNPI